MDIHDRQEMRRRLKLHLAESGFTWQVCAVSGIAFAVAAAWCALVGFNSRVVFAISAAAAVHFVAAGSLYFNPPR